MQLGRSNLLNAASPVVLVVLVLLIVQLTGNWVEWDWSGAEVVLLEEAEEELLLEVPQIVWGLNNQKIAIARAALTAAFLNRTLLTPLLSASLFHNSTHPAAPIPFHAVFSLPTFNSRCRGFAKIAPRPRRPPASAQLIKGSGRRWTAARDLRHLHQARTLLHHRLLQIEGKNPFLWPDHWPLADYIRIFHCLVLTDEILADVEFVGSKLAAAAPAAGGYYTAVHMRIERDWMIHCRKTEKRAAEREGKRLSICSGKEEIVERVRGIRSLKRPALVYLAVADDLLLGNASRGLLEGWGDDLVAVEKKRLGVLPIYAKHSYLVQAAMDYEVCSRAAVFVGNSFSTFSSLVVLDRSIRQPHSCISSFAYNLAADDGGARPWRTDLSKRFLSEISYESTHVSCQEP